MDLKKIFTAQYLRVLANGSKCTCIREKMLQSYQRCYLRCFCVVVRKNILANQYLSRFRGFDTLVHIW